MFVDIEHELPLGDILEETSNSLVEKVLSLNPYPTILLRFKLTVGAPAKRSGHPDTWVPDEGAEFECVSSLPEVLSIAMADITNQFSAFAFTEAYEIRQAIGKYLDAFVLSNEAFEKIMVEYQSYVEDMLAHQIDYEYERVKYENFDK